jgi:hypothetical protein
VKALPLPKVLLVLLAKDRRLMLLRSRKALELTLLLSR